MSRFIDRMEPNSSIKILDHVDLVYPERFYPVLNKKTQISNLFKPRRISQRGEIKKTFKRTATDCDISLALVEAYRQYFAEKKERKEIHRKLCLAGGESIQYENPITLNLQLQKSIKSVNISIKKNDEGDYSITQL